MSHSEGPIGFKFKLRGHWAAPDARLDDPFQPLESTPLVDAERLAIDTEFFDASAQSCGHISVEFTGRTPDYQIANAESVSWVVRKCLSR